MKNILRILTAILFISFIVFYVSCGPIPDDPPDCDICISQGDTIQVAELLPLITIPIPGPGGDTIQITNTLGDTIQIPSQSGNPVLLIANGDTIQFP
ncbi:MAG: hypothetical protein OEM46_08660 [Ignavibacteria bacterium]|nr:hypothetical protein [Ignavibacteria bacterium]